ncbi:MAG TPA: hypothetical protein ENJ80_14300 [Gammaproteobacteria bacterium]|nr:hypothetical protein [Gammaproteobacteria bacterium]
MTVSLYSHVWRWFAVSLVLIGTGAQAGVNGTVLWYLEREAGIEPYKVRYLVTEDFMRTDEGPDTQGFALFNRKTRQIYSVVPEDRTILRIDGSGDAPVVPQQLVLDIKQHADANAPAVEGRVPLTVELSADRELCHSAVVVPGFPGPARAAFQEFAQSLAIQQLRTLDSTPPEFRTPCFLSRYLYATDFYLQLGLPLVDWNNQGERRELIDYRFDVELDEALFELPEGYRTVEP